MKINSFIRTAQHVRFQLELIDDIRKLDWHVIRHNSREDHKCFDWLCEICEYNEFYLGRQNCYIEDDEIATMFKLKYGI